jgi:hypothetical protein
MGAAFRLIWGVTRQNEGGSNWAAGVLEYVFNFGSRSTGRGLDQRDLPRVGVCC